MAQHSLDAKDSPTSGMSTFHLLRVSNNITYYKAFIQTLVALTKA